MYIYIYIYIYIDKRTNLGYFIWTLITIYKSVSELTTLIRWLSRLMFWYSNRVWCSDAIITIHLMSVGKLRLHTPTCSTCSNICLLVKSNCFTASRLMADIWRLDIFRLSQLCHTSFVSGIGYESFHSSMVPAQLLCNFSGLSYYFPLHAVRDVSACPSFFRKRKRERERERERKLKRKWLNLHNNLEQWKRHLFCINVIAK